MNTFCFGDPSRDKVDTAAELFKLISWELLDSANCVWSTAIVLSNDLEDLQKVHKSETNVNKDGKMKIEKLN